MEYSSKEDRSYGIDEYHCLANEIVARAIMDWEMLVSRKAWEKAEWQFDELRTFFRSSWCDLLLNGTRIKGFAILKQLDDMLYAAKYGTSIKTWRKIKIKGRFKNA